MINIAPQPRRLRINFKYAADTDEYLFIDADGYLFIREVLLDAGYTELHDGTWRLLPVNEPSDVGRGQAVPIR
jgi:hypothetical protein